MIRSHTFWLVSRRERERGNLPMGTQVLVDPVTTRVFLTLEAFVSVPILVMGQEVKDLLKLANRNWQGL